MNKKAIAIFGVVVVVIVAVVMWNTWRRSSEEITIGAVLPLSGDGAKYGDSAKKAIDLVITEVNTQGGIDGKKVNVVYEDSKGVGKNGVSALQKLICSSNYLI